MKKKVKILIILKIDKSVINITAKIVYKLIFHYLLVNFMVMLPPWIHGSYEVICLSCSYKKIINGEKKWHFNPIEALLRIIFKPKCPNCGGEIVKNKCIIRH